jgi:glucose-1-phosphate thymidylyltransferase
MKGIILAGGSGTRLHPLTSVVSKQLLPVFDKPLIYYPLSTLISIGVDEILLISNPDQIDLFKNLLGNGNQFGVNISYEAQLKPKGIAEALIIGEDFINGSNCALILGDNIFISENLSNHLSLEFTDGAHIFTTTVEDPQRYGVLRIEDNIPIEIVEKPDKFISNQAVTGLYLYDKDASYLCKSLKPSGRNELEITELNQIYLKNNNLYCTSLGNSSIWMDAGTFDSLQDSSSYISSLQKRIGSLVGSPEYEALKNGRISKANLSSILEKSPTNSYYLALKRILETEIH